MVDAAGDDEEEVGAWGVKGLGKGAEGRDGRRQLVDGVVLGLLVGEDGTGYEAAGGEVDFGWGLRHY